MALFDFLTDMFFANANDQAGEDATRQSRADIMEMFGIGRDALNPWMARGNQAGDAFNAFLLGNNPALFEAFKNNTGFQSNLREGTNALSQNAATRGLLHSGGAAKALQEYGMDLNSQYADRFLGHLATPMGYGAGAAGNLAGLAGSAGNALAGNNWKGAEAEMGANANRANAFSNLFGTFEDAAKMFAGGW